MYLHTETQSKITAPFYRDYTFLEIIDFNLSLKFKKIEDKA